MLKRILSFAAVALIGLSTALFVTPALAADGFAIDVSGIIGFASELAAAALLAFGSWAVSLLCRKLKLEADSEVRFYLEQALEKAVAYGKAKAIELGRNVDDPEVKSEIVAEAANYLLPKVPDALKRFGITPDGLADLIRARLGDDQPKSATAA